MKISTKGRYAIKVMLDLAMRYGKGPVAVKEIADRQDISDKYLEQIVAMLHRAGLVKSIRGSKGGYVLADEPEKFTVHIILTAAEGDLAPVDCVGENGTKCEKRDMCVTRRIWQRLEDAINGVLDDIKLSDLVEWNLELADRYSI